MKEDRLYIMSGCLFLDAGWKVEPVGMLEMFGGEPGGVVLRDKEGTNWFLIPTEKDRQVVYRYLDILKKEAERREEEELAAGEMKDLGEAFDAALKAAYPEDEEDAAREGTDDVQDGDWDWENEEWDWPETDEDSDEDSDEDADEDEGWSWPEDWEGPEALPVVELDVTDWVWPGKDSSPGNSSLVGAVSVNGLIVFVYCIQREHGGSGLETAMFRMTGTTSGDEFRCGFEQVTDDIRAEYSALKYFS